MDVPARVVTSINLRLTVSRLLAVTLLAALAIGCDAPDSIASPGATPTGRPDGLTSARVIRVVDGDTIVVALEGRQERVRYIGIDTPESVDPRSPVECYGKEAAAENQRLVGGKQVYLARDISERDRFDRLLRYVYVDDAADELVFVNLALVAGGYAQVSTFPPDVEHETEFRAAQREARTAGRGLWGAC
jgi:micrococcal nuclease